MKKKNKVRLLSVITCLIVAIIMITAVDRIGFEKIKAYFYGIGFSDEFDDDNQPLSTGNYNALSDIEKQAYICILDNIRNHPEYIRIPKLTQDEFSNVFFAVKNDNPDILCFNDSCNMVTFMSACFLELDYAYTYDECKEMHTELKNKVNEIAVSLLYSDEYSAELAVHDYVVNNCKYNEDADNASNAYGCLIDGEAVCSGYSRAIMLLLDSVGIQSQLVGGTGINSDGEQISHMWNIVWIDGEPYHLDATWDDPDMNDIVSHMFFNLTTEEISVDHKDFQISAECNSFDANYFNREVLQFDDYNEDVLKRINDKLIQNIDEGKLYLEIRFTNDEAFREAEVKLIDNSSAESHIYKIISHLTDNSEEDIVTTHISFVKDPEKKYIRLMFDKN